MPWFSGGLLSTVMLPRDMCQVKTDSRGLTPWRTVAVYQPVASLLIERLDVGGEGGENKEVMPLPESVSSNRLS